MQYATKDQLAREINNGVPGYFEEPSPFMDLFFEHRREHLITTRIDERKETLKLGETEIPKIGHHIIYVSNFDKHGAHPDVRKYPQMNVFHKAGIIERVDEVSIHDKNIDLTIGVYLVEDPNAPRLYNLRRGNA